MDNYAYCNVMIIDDSEIDVLVGRRLMELTHFASHVTILSSGEEAVDFLKNEVGKAEQVPELILLDMHLPGMSGSDFINIFKTLPGYITDKTKIVMLSAYQKQEEIDKLLQNKFIVGQLDKPLTQETLKKLLALKTEGVAVTDGN